MMHNLAGIEMLISGALALGFGFYQLWTLRHHKLGSRPEDAPRHPEREHEPDDG